VFGKNGMTIFKGLKTNITTQLMHKHVPYFSDAHCMAHYTNLVMQTLNSLNLVSKIEKLLDFLYDYFAHSLKQHVSIFQIG